MAKSSLTYVEVLQRDADEYFEEHPLATSHDLAVWAIRSGRWEPPSDLILRRCREDYSRALREQYIQDGSGKPVRAKHAARIIRGGRQQTFWGDIRTSPPEHMTIAFQQRREQIVGDCRQLHRDVNFYNSFHSLSQPVQMVFDFRDDIEEGEFA